MSEVNLFLETTWNTFRPNADIALQRAQRGLAWLKNAGPSYGFDHTRIDSEIVAVSDSTRCPLAQANLGARRYSAALNRVGRFVSGMPLHEWITEHGFDVSPWDSANMYIRLTNAWRLVLREDTLNRNVTTS